MVGTYCPGRDGSVHFSGPLPKHLTVLELARTFYDEASHLDFSTPADFPPLIHAHQTSITHPSITTPVPDVTQASYRSPTSTITSDTTHQPILCCPTHIQGFVANATRTTTTPQSRSAPNFPPFMISQYLDHVTNRHAKLVGNMATQQTDAICLPWLYLFSVMPGIGPMQNSRRPWRQTGLNVRTSPSFHVMIAPHGPFGPITVQSLSSGKVRWTGRWIGISSTTYQRSRRTRNDSYGKLVSQFPHLLLTMALRVNISPMSLLTLSFHEHILLALMTLILHAFQIGSHLPINPSTTHHNQKTIIFPMLLHLTLPKPMTSLESCLIILKFTIQLHTKHTPSPWSVYLLSAQHQQLQWLTLGLMSVLLAIIRF